MSCNIAERMRQTIRLWSIAVIASGMMIAQPGRLGDPARSPASQPPPKTVTPQVYTAAQIRAGEPKFISQCGFCHGRDAAGGEGGSDLTRSKLVAETIAATRSEPWCAQGVRTTACLRLL